MMTVIPKSDQIDWEYCPKCDEHVEGDMMSYSCVGQYGMNVYCVVFCTQCGFEIRSKLVDKDI